MVELRVINATADDDEAAACIAAIQYLLQYKVADNERLQIAVTPAWRAASLLESTGRIKRISDAGQINCKFKTWKSLGFHHTVPAALVVALAALAAIAPARAEGGTASQAVLRPPIPVSEDGIPLPGNSSAPAAASPLVSAPAPAAASPRSNVAAGASPRSNVAAGGSPLQQAGSLRSSPDASPLVSKPEEPPLPVAPSAMSIQDVTRPGGPNQTIRVLLAAGRTLLQFNFPDGAVLKDCATGDVMAQLPPQSRWQVALRSRDTYPQLSFSGTIGSARHSRVLIASRGEYRKVSFTPNAPAVPNMVPIPPNITPRFWLPASRNSSNSSYRGRAYMLMPAQADGVIATQGRLYRGTLMVRPNVSGSFDVINYVELEDYLQSVVPSEMPSGWPLEALKAQAIAARSYATANMGKHEADGYDVKANTEDQVYAGVSPESLSSNLAVAQTHGAVLRCAGNVVTAYFHSSSGGWTEAPENVWGKPLPFLKAVADYDDASPHFSWSRACSTGQAEHILNRSGHSVGMLLTLHPVCRGESPRVRYLLASGTRGSVMLTGEEARKLFALPSTCFNVAGRGGSYVFAGRGFGHGLGMSQWGAKHLAELGYCAPDILNYYYKDVSIERM
ncbi:MAG TPA: SpoIID/LytB domain-containing protein [Candidatus Obscuribacterales bacterium]